MISKASRPTSWHVRLVVTALCAALGAYPVAAARAGEALPSLGDPASDELSPSAERKVGEEIMREAREAGDIFDDPESTEYLNRFGETLIAHAPPNPQDFEFFLVLDPNINAFALPGGHIGVNTGLIVATQSESELASVMGHEMGHVIQRHIARSLDHEAQTTPIALAAMILGALAMAKSSSPDAGAAALTMGQGYLIQDQLAFSRDAEREADRVGFQILQDSGFDVSGMESFFLRLQTATRIYESGAPEWLRDHPLTTERIADIQNRIHETHYHQRPDSADFQFVRSRLRVLQDVSSQGLYDTRLAFEGQLKTGAYASEAAIRYGLALVDARQKRFDEARSQLAQAEKVFGKPDIFLASLDVEIRLATDDLAGAVATARTAFSEFPQSHALARRVAETLQHAGRHDEAIAFLQDEINQYHSEPLFYELLAKSYQAKGQAVLEHQALAEQYYLNGNLAAAIEQLKLARNAKDGDFYALSQIDARMRDWKSRWEDIQKDQKSARRSSDALEGQFRAEPGVLRPPGSLRAGAQPPPATGSTSNP